MRFARSIAVSIVLLMCSSVFVGMASAIPPDVYANMRAYYTHENPEAVDGPVPNPETDTDSRDSSRDIVKYFDIDVSIGWDATPNEFQTWETEIKNANKKLYDGTDGQMAFRRVDIYNDRERWDTVDVHINNGNGRAYTYRGGILYSNLHIELFKNDAGMGGKVLQHEWGHYGLYLPDEYTDSHGPFCSCTMGTTYNTNEWCCESNHCDYDPSYCSSHGEAASCWKQMKQRYPALTEKDPPVAGPYDAPDPDFVWHYPDLYTSDGYIRLTPQEPRTGDTVTIEVDVFNKESLIQKNVDVSFYDTFGGSKLLSSKSEYISSFKTTFSTTWVAEPGEHTIEARIDPNNIINEITNDNNTAKKSIYVNTPPVISDTLQELHSDEDEPLVIDMSKYESDEEDGYDSPDLKWTVTSHSASVITHITGEDSVDDVLTLTPKPDWNGMTLVEFTLTDSTGLSTSKDVDVHFDAVNDLPKVETLESPVTVLYRGEYTTFSMTGTDIEDPMDLMSGEIEYKHADAPAWTFLMTDYNSIADTFDASLYTESYFQPGWYDIRGRLIDRGMIESQWFYLNGSLEIRNNPPVVEAVQVGDEVTEMYRGEEVTITILASDVENMVDYLVPSVAYSICGDEEWEMVEAEAEFIDDHFEVLFVPDTDLEVETYCLKINMEDEDGTLSDDFITDEFDILNNAPTVTDISFAASSVLRTETLLLTISGEDVEDENKDLTLEVNYRLGDGAWEQAFVDHVTFQPADSSWTAKFTPPKKARVGPYQLSARLTDLDGDAGEWSEPADAVVEVENNLPKAEISPVKTATEGQSASFDASGSSDLEDSGLTYTWDFGDKKTGKGVKVSHTYSRAGKYKVTLKVSDTDGGEAEDTTYIQVEEAGIFGGGGDGGSSGLGSSMAIAAAALGVLIVIILLVAMILRRRAKASVGPMPGDLPPSSSEPTTSTSHYDQSPPSPPPPPGPPQSYRPDQVEYQVEGYQAYDGTEAVQYAYPDEEERKVYE